MTPSLRFSQFYLTGIITICLSLLVLAPLSAQTITTIAGSGSEGKWSDEIPATSARLSAIYRLGP